MNQLHLTTTTIVLVLLICVGYYPEQAQAENTHGNPAPSSTPKAVAHSLERHQEIRTLSMTRQNGPVFVPDHSPSTLGKPTTILFTFNEPDLSTAPAFVNSTRQTIRSHDLNISRVAIVFGHEGWRTLHTLQKVTSGKEMGTETGPHSSESGSKPVFFIYYDLNRHDQEELTNQGKPLEYRFVVDGVWMADPANQLSSRKMSGVLVSLVDLSQAPKPAVQSPEVIMPTTVNVKKIVQSRTETATLTAMASSRQARTVILRWVGDDNQQVQVAGTFNQFDPYMTPMETVGSDPRNPSRTVYETKLRLLAGQYYYHFVINGDTYLDPLNAKHGQGPEGRAYSQLQIP